MPVFFRTLLFVFAVGLVSGEKVIERRLPSGGLIEDLHCRSVGEWGENEFSPCRSTISSSTAGVNSVRIKDCVGDPGSLKCEWVVHKRHILSQKGKVEIANGSVKCSEGWRYNGNTDRIDGCNFQFTARYLSVAEPQSPATLFDWLVTGISFFVMIAFVALVLHTCGDGVFFFGGVFLLLLNGISGDGEGGTCSVDWHED